MFYHIGSPRVLELGSFGDLPAKESQLVNEPPKRIMIKSISNSDEGIPNEIVAEPNDLVDTIIYETYEDAAGIYIDKLSDDYIRIKQHFANPYVYRVSPNFGEFEYNGKLKKINFDTYKANKKCLKVLFDFINDKIEKIKFLNYIHVGQMKKHFHG
jgi:hypothetical protein